jgi:DNA-binding MarR family transcriptional regulator
MLTRCGGRAYLMVRLPCCACTDRNRRLQTRGQHGTKRARISLHNCIGWYITAYGMSTARAQRMSNDVVKDLGYLTLGTRLKRLGERLQGQTQVLLEHAGVDLPACHFPVLAALERLGVMNVGEVAVTLGISQPGVTRMLDKLEADGLVRSTQLADDRRVRTIALTRSGRQLISRSKRTVWPVIEAAVADACAGPAEPLLAVLAALEQALAAAPLSVRTERLRSGEGSHAAA